MIEDVSIQGCDIIRLRTREDIAVVLNEFDGFYHDLLFANVGDLGQYARKLSRHSTVLATVDGDVLGFLAFYANDAQTGGAYLAQLAVRPDARGKSIGRVLLHECVRILRRKKFRTLKLEVKKTNATARRFYEANGFAVCGEASDDSIYMIREIQSRLLEGAL